MTTAIDALRVERLKAAIEGECDGLAITDAHAKAILEYVDAAEKAEPDAYLYTFAVPGTGEVTRYASVYDHERRDGITDKEWESRALLPLYTSPK